ncbi:MAG: hypothetical protein QG568_444 [Patescibacteria group bacterium]|nr:hypothetical protein [Patescibacteria group bacterium]
MSNRQRFYFALAFAAFVILLHKIAHELYLYWTYRWVDIPMHILGGIMAGLFTFVFLRITRLPESIKNLLIGVMIVGVGWEVLELLYKVDALSTRYWIDTIKDLIDDTIGGFISIYIWKKIPNQK